RRIKKKAPRVRVVDALEGDLPAERGSRNAALLIDPLQSGAKPAIVGVAVDVQLERRGLGGQLEAVRLQHRDVAELRVEPDQLGKKQRVGDPQIILEISKVIELSEAAAQHLVTLEAEQAR